MIIVVALCLQNEKYNRMWSFNNSYFQMHGVVSYQSCEMPFWEGLESGELGDKEYPYSVKYDTFILIFEYFDIEYLLSADYNVRYFYNLAMTKTTQRSLTSWSLHLVVVVVVMMMIYHHPTIMITTIFRASCVPTVY